MTAHRIERVGPLPVKMRRLTVRSVERPSPRYARVVLEGADLEGFSSPGPDDHVKLFFPAPGSTEPDRSRMRDFTPRRFDANTLTIDFALHGSGLANTWAENAKPGSELFVGGPRGSTRVPYDFDWYLLLGDESALPAIARRLEELPTSASVRAFIEVNDERDVQTLARHVTWLFRHGTPAGTSGLLPKVLRDAKHPSGDGFIFAAGESNEMREVREVLQQRGHPRDWARVTAYWKRGISDFHEGH